MRSSNPVQRQSIINRFKDYLSLSNNKELLLLHKEINDILEKSINDWHAYDYGQSYYYQSYKKISITGLRDTESRIKEMGLTDLIKEKNVFEVGSNTGFISLNIASFTNSVTAIENNQFLVDIANACAKYLDINNVNFIVDQFENYKSKNNFEVVLSFANHSTIDNQTSQSLGDYFLKCSRLLHKNGILVFESHPPGFEKANLSNTIKEISKLFEIKSQKNLKLGSKLDQKRTMIVGKLKD